jgi:hypothetical protein
VQPGQDLERLRRLAADQLPRYAVPTLWAVVPEFPTTRNGEVDIRRLETLVRADDA